MAVKLPLVLTAGQVEQLQSGDTISAGAATYIPFFSTAGVALNIPTVSGGLLVPFFTAANVQNNFPLV